MAREDEIVEHPGIITDINRDKLVIKILQLSACASCHSKAMCGVAGMEEKIVETPRLSGIDHKIGDKVTLVMKRTSGNRAVFLGYYLPFLIVVITLIVMLSITQNEGLSGLVSIGILLPYYLVLFIIKDRITKKMEIRVKQ
ncbi:MAG: SoxR reducing system RseC family protein [Bacteroidales bacterium]|nr:SoxR reducing system RseC family protein [Bacteroidales bacterium]